MSFSGNIYIHQNAKLIHLYTDDLNKRLVVKWISQYNVFSLNNRRQYIKYVTHVKSSLEFMLYINFQNGKIVQVNV